jgi:hypothetical protein
LLIRFRSKLPAIVPVASPGVGTFGSMD